jgi:hypothetical protein
MIRKFLTIAALVTLPSLAFAQGTADEAKAMLTRRWLP